MYIHGLIPRNFAELAEAVPIDKIRVYSQLPHPIWWLSAETLFTPNFFSSLSISWFI